jgi:DNA-directed RNA polymerase specialized sigma24 family protein
VKKKYSDNTRLLILNVLDRDIKRFSYQYFIPGLEHEDIAQELRLFVWTYDHLYNPHVASIRTWGNQALRSALKNLYTAHCVTDKRKANTMTIEFDDSKDHEYEED